MAGGRPDRRPVRRQLRGRQRKLHPARRCRLGGVPFGDRRRGALARPAALEHGVDLRIRRPRRVLAPSSAVRRLRHPRHRLWRRNRAGAFAGAGGGHAVRRLGDRKPRPQMDRIPGHAARRGARTSATGRAAAHGSHGRAAARLVHGALLGQHRPARRRGRRLRLCFRFLTPTTCPTGSGLASAIS